MGLLVLVMVAHGQDEASNVTTQASMMNDSMTEDGTTESGTAAMTMPTTAEGADDQTTEAMTMPPEMTTVDMNQQTTVMADFHRNVSVPVSVSVEKTAKYVRITLIRKNSVRTP